ncbi:hypothetical protein [Microbulbifer sp. TYP-18]|uniref:hypothetical protein n=1 Tax=Microbulbifer sp. TYP-18 TaxID=3230024 RepID=UPI0034C60BD7
MTASSLEGPGSTVKTFFKNIDFEIDEKKVKHEWLKKWESSLEVVAEHESNEHKSQKNEWTKLLNESDNSFVFRTDGLHRELEINTDPLIVRSFIFQNNSWVSINKQNSLSSIDNNFDQGLFNPYRHAVAKKQDSGVRTRYNCSARISIRRVLPDKTLFSIFKNDTLLDIKIRNYINSRESIIYDLSDLLYSLEKEFGLLSVRVYLNGRPIVIDK